MTDDMDTAHYDHQEAASLKRRGWWVVSPEDLRPVASLCIGVDYEGCLVRTPRQRCRYCLKTRRLRRAA